MSLRGALLAIWPRTANPELRIPVTGHLAELRQRLILALFALGLGGVLAWSMLDWLYAWLTVPVGKVQLLAISPGEGLATDLRLAIAGGCCLALPVWLVQTALFVKPALSRVSGRALVLIVLAALLLATLGAAVGYRLVLPPALDFLLTRGAQPPAWMSVGRYIGFAMASIIATAVVFELPLMMLALARLGIVRSASMRRFRRQGWLILVIAAAILTPSTDALTLILLSGPLILLYEGTLLLMRVIKQ